MKKYLISFCFLMSALAIPAMAVETGAETGHGTGGNRRHRAPKSLSARGWCSDFGAMVAEAFDDAHEADSLEEKHASLVSSIQYILSSYHKKKMPFQPLTYSLLEMALKLDKNFPSNDEKGDQAGGIVLVHMLKTAQYINAEFDIPHFVPALESWSRCGRYRCKGESDLASEFYVDYLASARAVVNMLFIQATDRNPNVLVLDAMAYDRWKLNAALDVLGFILKSLKNDLIGSNLNCLKERVQHIRDRLAKYLENTPVSPVQDRAKREVIERQLREILDELNSVTEYNGHWSCGSSR